VPEHEAFAEVVARELAPLLSEHGLRLVSEDEFLVRFESATLGAEADFDPRGEVVVGVFRLGREAAWERWTYSGMVGRASVPRLLEIACERLTAEDAVLRGDEEFFDRLSTEKREAAAKWTAYYSGKGPQPTGKLPYAESPALREHPLARPR
jgi:hypothetical protein